VGLEVALDVDSVVEVEEVDELVVWVVPMLSSLVTTALLP